MSKRNKGIATLEVLIAFAIIILSLTAVIVVVFGNQSVAVDTELNQQALYKAEATLETARAQAREDFLSVTPIAPLIEDGLFTVSLDVGGGDCVKPVTSTVTYATEGRPQTTSINSLLGSVAELLKLGGNCDVTPPSSDWDNPSSYGRFDSPTIEATAIDVIQKNGKTLIFLGSKKPGSGTPPGANPDDFWVLELPDSITPTDPIFRGSTNLDKERVSDIYATRDGYAYVAQASTTAQFLVIDIQNPTAPELIRSLNLPSYSGTCAGGNCPHGLSVFYYNNRIYVGAHYTGFGGGNEFHIYRTDGPGSPANPQHVASLDINHNINDILVRGDYAYLATSYNNGELMIVDINPSSPDYLGLPDTTGMKFNAPGDSDGTSLYLSGNKILLGRQRNNNTSYLNILDISNPRSIRQLGEINIDNPPDGLGNLNPNTEVVGLSVRNNVAFVATSDQTKPFQVLDISNPAHPVPISACATYNYSEKASGLDFVDNLGFVSNESNNALRVIYDQPSVCS